MCMFNSLTPDRGGMEVKDQGTASNFKKEKVTTANFFSTQLDIPLVFHPIDLG